MEFTRKEYDIIAKNRGIIEPQKMYTQELLNALSRCDSRCKVKSICKKLSKIGLGKIAKKQYFKKWIKSSQKAAKKKSIDELKAIDRFGRIKNG